MKTRLNKVAFYYYYFLGPWKAFYRVCTEVVSWDVRKMTLNAQFCLQLLGVTVTDGNEDFADCS